GVLIKPLEDDLGWSRASISLAISIGLVLYGFAAPLGGSLLDRFGPRRVMVLGLGLTLLSTTVSAVITSLWQFTAVWGVLGGIGTGMVAVVLGAAVANRWFVARRGLVTGIFGAASSAGQLIFIPLLVWLVIAVSWRGAMLFMSICAIVLILPVLLLMRDSPSDIGLRPLGGSDAPADLRMAGATNRGVMRRAVRVPDFWLLSGSFFICGATSTGLIGTHFLAHSIDAGVTATTAATVLAIMGMMNFGGTIASGWLTDRYDPRKLLAMYYIVRGLSLFLLPFVLSTPGLLIFAIFFGLDYIATVPPTVALTADIFGRRNIGTVFGWIFAAHMFGAAVAAWISGVARDWLGDYQLAFIAGGAFAIVGGLMSLRVNRDAQMAPEAVVAAA
ncbi:MAG TPA: MFS transporter, partial [Thermomicrobiales bacterium]|nr:MFS transporter [Thermomicrobiales bacterium]